MTGIIERKATKIMAKKTKPKLSMASAPGPSSSVSEMENDLLEP